MPKYIPETYFINPAHEEIAKARYYLKDLSGTALETDIFQTFQRVNNYIFQNDPIHKEIAQRLCEDKKIMYAGRPLAQAGTAITNMFNCFVLGIDDSREAISECQRIHFHIQAHGGGTGINFSKLRPSGSWCKGANARSSGPEGFITAMGYLSANISQGGNRCLPGDALVAMSDGAWKRIDQVRPGDQVIAFDKNAGKTIPSKVLNFFENGIQDVYEYRLASGKSVRSTNTHRWLGAQTDGTLLVRTVKEMPESSTKIGFIQELPYFGVETSKWSSILGFLIGDGCFTGDTIKLSVQNDQVRRRFIDSIPEGCTYWENDTDVFIGSGGHLQDYLRHTALYRCLAHEKFIPDEVFSYSRNDLIAVIEGLFATDGSVNATEVAYYSTSLQLIQDLTRLLLKFGISGYVQADNRARKGKVRRTLWSLRIKHPTFYNRFVEIFDVPGKRGEPKVNSSIAHRLRDDVYFHKIQEVRNLGPDVTYCIEIDHPDHLFIVEGAVSHNSGANMGILEDWHPGLLKFITKKSRSNWESIRKFAVISDENKFKQWQWLNPYQWQTFNVSVGLSDEFMRQVKREVKKTWRIHWKDEDWHLWDFKVVLKDYLPSGDVLETPTTITVCAPNMEIAIHEASNELPFRNNQALELLKGPYDLTAYEWFHRICSNAWEDGCPGVFFIDRARAYHNGEYFNKLEATNPCHRGNSLIHTDKGLIRIKDLSNDVFTVVTPTGELARAICFPTGTGRIFRVKFRQGGYIDLTANHNLIDYDSKHKIQVQDLKTGHQLLAPTLPISPINAKFTGDESDGFLLGWVFGDGCIFSRKSGKEAGRAHLFTMVGKNDGDDIADFVLKRLNLLKTNRSRVLNWSDRKGNRELVSSDPGIIEWFSDKYHLPYSKQEGIPISILQGSRDLQRGFLQGLFSSDGTVSKNGRRIGLTSSREEVVFHTKCLLHTFGIRSTYRMCKVKLKGKDFTRGDLTITGSEAVKFFERIGFGLHSRKNNLCSKWKGRFVNTDKDYVVVDSVVDLGIEEPVYNITVDHPLHQYIVNSIVSANCAEQILPRWSVCCLSSVVLPEFVKDDGSIDWDGLKESVSILVRALNNITMLNKTDVEQIDKNTRLERRIGLGTIGMHELLIRCSLRTGEDYLYSEDSGRALAKKILKFIKHSAYEASIDLAAEIGPFPAFEYEGFAQSKFVQQLLKERPDLDEKLKKNGIANVTILTQAPTGCQSPDTLVATDQGILTLGELVDANGQTWQPHKLRVLQDKDFYLYSGRGFVNGHSPTKKITLESGIELEATPNHQYRVFSLDGKYLWRRADALAVGDVVASRIGGYTKATDATLNTDVETHFNNQAIKLPTSMSPEFARFLGMYFADGSNHRKGIRIHLNANEKLENDAIALFIEKICGIYPSRIVSRGCESLYINSTLLLRFLSINGISKQKSHEVEIPTAVRSSSAASLQAFLDGYAYCDGSSSSYTSWIDTCSPKMAQQIAVCMRLLGTNSVIQTTSNREKAKGNRSMYRVKKLNFGSIDFDEQKLRYITKDRRVLRELASAQDKHLHFDVVEAVEDSTNLTLDIEVPETETYIANSIVSHNTTGTITGYSSGCEPYFAMAYMRNSNIGTIMDGCPSFTDWLKSKDINYGDYKFNLKELRKSKRVPKVFEEAQEISWNDHLQMQAVFAEQIDSSVSKTINLPNSATVEDIMQAYVGAYDMGIKSTAVYRDGSKTQILETLKNTAKSSSARPPTIITIGAPKRPEDLTCDIHAVSVKGDKWKVLVGLLHGKPYEIFCFPEEQIQIPSSKNKGDLRRGGNGRYDLVIGSGEDTWVIKDIAKHLLNDEHRMITRLLSTSLRHGAPLSALVDQLSKCDGDITTFSKAMLRVLRKYISEEEILAVSKCSACGGSNLTMQEGCSKCADCGTGACS